MKHIDTDTDLEKDGLGQSAIENEQQETETKKPLTELVSKLGMRTFDPEKFISKRNRHVRFWFLLTVIISLSVLLHYLWSTDHMSSAAKLLPIDKVEVTAIVHSDEKVFAVISGNVVYERDVVSGYKVIKIHKDKVELEKNGKRVIKQVYKKSSPVDNQLTIH
ncbi:MAG: hypothetical protein ACYS30_03655 [Planctomycetota bacterium]|jgi:hypothetical protein